MHYFSIYHTLPYTKTTFSAFTIATRSKGGEEMSRDYCFHEIFRFGDPIRVVDGITDDGIFIALQGNQLIWVRHDGGTNEVRLVYSPFDQVSVERIT